jgi:hypothetical protein
MTSTQNTVAKPVRKRKVKSVKTPVFERLETLQRRGSLVGTTFTLHYFDGTRKVQTITKKFLVTEKGTKKSTTDLLMDMNAIVHDDMASHFTI